MSNQISTHNQAPKKIYLKDYTPPNFQIKEIYLNICLYDDCAVVESHLQIKRIKEGDLALFGEELQLEEIRLDDRVLSKDEYCLGLNSLMLHKVPDEFRLFTRVKIVPQKNTTLEGLYQSGNDDDVMFVTQCEPEGFRKITFFPDRPDVLTRYTTRLEAPKRFKTLLANGNLIQAGELNDSRHYAVWQDPTYKPSYLFACVMADLDVLQDEFITMEGRKVLLEIYAEKKDIQKCHVAMQALKDSMAWDEKNYGRAYDLDRYMIVATSMFNMGAMENKGLNIFNTSCVLSSPQTTTDERNFRVKSVIAHEYFHNWTGNRITCRDWFQLCLKEGLTVFRDQCFSADFRSKAVQRIDDVSLLRCAQFAEDAGSLAHPVRPESFVEINNFYTMTVYEKGAEIVRMMANLLGEKKFRQGMDEYFNRYDGQAVTVEDFLSALSVSDERIMDFLAWYRQPGTPVLSGFTKFYQNELTLHFEQSTRQVAGYDKPKALPIPIDVAIFDSQTGKMLAQDILLMNQSQQSFQFKHLCLDKNSYPVVSVLRNFSAPVKLEFEQSNQDLLKLLQFEKEGFNRWQAMQTLVNRWLLSDADDEDAIQIATTLSGVVNDLIDCDAMLAARLFDIPSEKELAMAYETNYQPKNVRSRRNHLKKLVANAVSDKLSTWYNSLNLLDYQDTPEAMGRRQLQNVLLNLALTAKISEASDWAKNQYQQASCMSQRLGALSAILNHDGVDKSWFLNDFYQRFNDDDLVIDSWFYVQAMAKSATSKTIQELMQRQDYDWRTPNRVRTTLLALTANPVELWSKEGVELYLSSVVRLDKLNPLLAARLLSELSRWYTLHSTSRKLVEDNLKNIENKVSSKNVLEVLHQLLSSA